MAERISVHICTRNRWNYLAVLLSSLLEQTFQKFDIILVDNLSDIPLMNDHACMMLINRLRMEGHIVKYVRLAQRLGNPIFRQAAVDLEFNPIAVRVDDDSFLEKDYLEKLYKALKSKKDAGAVGGICPSIGHQKYYAPIPKYFNEITKHGDTIDHCVYFFKGLKKKVYPCGHIRSAFMYYTDRMKQIGGYKNMEAFGNTGHREETDICLRFKLHGYQNYFVPDAVAWHFMAPTGAGRDVHKNPEKHRQEVFKGDQLYKDRMKHWEEVYGKKLSYP